ncbi:MAG: dihydrofolate reductase [Bacteroidales bacterium]|nr:dihydrofolate reductase [Bacteroidales bacterium]
MISIIVAAASNNAIGKNNDLLWHIPDDLKRFKKLTLGHCLIMGRKTWDSIGGKALKGRRNVVMTHQENLCKDAGCIQVASVEDALAQCSDASEIFIAGGETVYSQFMDLADRIYLTRVHKEYDDADTFFPGFDTGDWEITDKEENISSPDLDLSWSYITYQRKK